MILSRKSHILFLGVYILLLFATAVTRDFGLTRFVMRSSNDIVAAFVEPTWKLLFWILPILGYRTWIQRDPLLYLHLNNVQKGILFGILGSIFPCLQVIPFLLGRQTLLFTHSFDEWLNGVLLVGLIEETIFRGFLFQQFQLLFNGVYWDLPLLPMTLKDEVVDLTGWMPSRRTFWAATLSSALFVGIHFPPWILYQHQSLGLIVSGIFFILFFGYYLCFVFHYSQSLWSCILIHMVNNFIHFLRSP